MSLGADNAVCKQEYIDTMRARMEADKPGSGVNLDNPDVQKTFESFGQAFYRIATVHAETLSDSGADADFWTWINQVSGWLGALATWQVGVAHAFANWSAVGVADQALKSAVTALATPGSPPSPAPTLLRGRIR